MRDSQRGKVYLWEKLTFPDLWRDVSLTNAATRDLLYKVVSDAGRDPRFIRVEFTKRKGNACADWRGANFTPGRISPIIVLHEAAHVLTYGPGISSDIRDEAGHGPRYVACYLALLNRYLGIDLTEAMKTLRLPLKKVVRDWVKVATGGTVMVPVRRPDGTIATFPRPAYEHRLVEKVTYKNPPAVDMTALKLWRAKLGCR